jgi:hypothetical protein
MCGQRHAPVVSLLRKRGTHCGERRVDVETDWTAREVPRPLRFNPRTVHNLASRYGGASLLKAEIYVFKNWKL